MDDIKTCRDFDEDETSFVKVCWECKECFRTNDRKRTRCDECEDLLDAIQRSYAHDDYIDDENEEEEEWHSRISIIG